MKHTRKELNVIRQLQAGTMTIASAAKALGQTRMGFTYRYTVIDVYRRRKGLRR